MPTIITRGAISARSAGTFAYVPPAPLPPPPPGPPPPPPPPGPPPPGPILQTVTFTSSGSWTAPAGVTFISNLTIAGGVGTFVPAYWAWSTQTAVSNIFSIPGTSVVPGPYTYAQAGAAADLVIAAMNSGGTGDRIASWPQLQLGTHLLGGTPLYWTQDLGDNSNRIRGEAVRASGPWDNRSSAIANGTGEFWYVGVEVYIPDSTSGGGPSSAFGYTVDGVGPNQSQNVINFGSLNVTPGQTYSIQVGTSSGYVQFQFVQS